MADVTTTHTGVKVTLVLDEAEAQYVEAALLGHIPAHLGTNEPWRELHGAMIDAGIELDRTAAV